MKKVIFIFFIMVCTSISGQVGINTAVPSAAFDIVSKGNTSATKALEINNSDNQKLLEMLDNGNMGINLGASGPTDRFHVKTDVKHQNLPVLSPPYSPLGADASGAAKVKLTDIKYFYYKRTTGFGNFSLSNTNTYTSIPFINGTDVRGNTVGFGFGSEPSGTVNGRAVSNLNYLIIPEPGVYLFEMYQTARCDSVPTSQSNTGQIELNTVFAAANAGSSVYTTNTIFRDYLVARRNASGSVSSSRYAYANPQKLVVAYQSTSMNEKVALLINYVGGDSYAAQDCYMNKPNSSDNYGYLIVTKL
ncbi:hypothetical protein HNP38_003188 [Chryseobacterium defluvii]|uniref:C1q domain-containing protein n=1 Tax=Chryseobacterium defluvii TaxID=160396 RepID=A0A840KLZ0_9FLAO|nr:hypothetical protein [Chryseobacterium defluvii]MBB4807872.1 hypothetical protein [Chryseobacterium defluvii]